MKARLPGVLWLLLIGAVASVAVAAQTDRQSRYQPELAPLVAEPFRSFSQAHFARAALSPGVRSEMALAEARKLIERRPLPAENLALLAQAQLASDPQGAGLNTIQLAARRGWRDPMTQRAMLALALSAGDHEEAALRLAAIWALSGDDDELARLSRPVLAQAPAREVLGRLLASDVRWETAFIQRGARVIEPEIYAQVILLALNQGAQFDCDLLSRALMGSHMSSLRDEILANCR